ncbi:cation:dicarboxylase symporter family transporter [Pedobacter sp. BS3]|uniref:dicarboxylate/amino acid:cation symporter n=1 Tax=Pedobacter sp. BS3 TaxID=2567937 RepID=UPI0011EBE2BE|nr:cation:dicarboxylase symporter family transporter [Pedobacter sp. BS3]TZF84848.1 cation:dicarboxylase symporter family transporter [Pedobacter sp. BS3]
MKLKKTGLISLVCITISAILATLNYYQWLIIPPDVLFISRWITILTLIAWGFQKRTLTAWIFIFMVIGAEIGHDFPQVAIHLQVLSKVFLKLIKAVVAPLLFGTLVYGIAGHSDLKQVGRMGWKSLVYFEAVTTIALFIGLAVINISKAGVGIVKPKELTEQLPQVPTQSVDDIILHIFPENIAKSIAEGQILQIVVFSILFGIALALVKPAKREPMLKAVDSLSEVMFKFTNIVMYFAPVGVGAAIAYTVGHMGLGILFYLLQLLITLYLGLIVFLLVVLLPIALIVGVPVKAFVKAIAEPVSIAFATTSSEAALPRAMEEMNKLGVPKKIVAFVMPTGYSFNLDGTTLYLSIAAVFVAQAAGMHLTFGHQLLIVFTLMLTSKGIAGVPRASLVILLGTAASFGMPVWPIFIILGIDELMDMARTSVNVIGNCLATVVIAKWEKEFRKPEETPVADEVAVFDYQD